MTAMCVAMVARVVSVEGGDSHVAVVDDGRGRHRVSLALLALEDGGGLAPGEWVVVHTGLVVRRVSGAVAAEMRSES